MTGCQGWFPELISTRVYSLHHVRQMCNTILLTESHKNILMNLLKLATSQYSRIRAKAQETILYALSCYPNAYKIMVPHFIEILQLDPMEHHEAFKVSIRRFIWLCYTNYLKSLFSVSTFFFYLLNRNF